MQSFFQPSVKVITVSHVTISFVIRKYWKHAVKAYDNILYAACGAND